ncbi:uncharacterized protein SETTUDRAFT_34034 [Exserohilum turcica Et28A]|uniref:Uncharacterized protein n=1 Tax=Exserohilum turcicum (strain 28A) TaxID=671987 RepID=R0K215_EXST2|nr:uncharacterized protein SETTUDRAFT_34034 [Exserohilum turcica Et28A]EOA82462.1 hypothetical protein SETTUDRAFT_34034 [Exserohilum turcica Et28A]
MAEHEHNWNTNHQHTTQPDSQDENQNADSHPPMGQHGNHPVTPQNPAFQPPHYGVPTYQTRAAAASCLVPHVHHSLSPIAQSTSSTQEDPMIPTFQRMGLHESLQQTTGQNLVFTRIPPAGPRYPNVGPGDKDCDAAARWLRGFEASLYHAEQMGQPRFIRIYNVQRNWLYRYPAVWDAYLHAKIEARVKRMRHLPPTAITPAPPNTEPLPMPVEGWEYIGWTEALTPREDSPSV